MILGVVRQFPDRFSAFFKAPGQHMHGLYAGGFTDRPDRPFDMFKAQLRTQVRAMRLIAQEDGPDPGGMLQRVFGGDLTVHQPVANKKVDGVLDAPVPIVPGPGVVSTGEAIQRGATPIACGGSVYLDLGTIDDRTGDPEVDLAAELPLARAVVDLGGFGRPAAISVLVAAASALGLSVIALCRSLRRLSTRGIVVRVDARGGADASAEAATLVGEDVVRRMSAAGLVFVRGAPPRGVGQLVVPAATVASLLVLYLVARAHRVRHTAALGAAVVDHVDELAAAVDAQDPSDIRSVAIAAVTQIVPVFGALTGVDASHFAVS